MLIRLLTTKLCKDSCIRRNDEVSDHQRPPLADEAQPCLPTRQGNSGISLIVVNIRTSRKKYDSLDKKRKNIKRSRYFFSSIKSEVLSVRRGNGQRPHPLGVSFACLPS